MVLRAFGRQEPVLLIHRASHPLPTKAQGGMSRFVPPLGTTPRWPATHVFGNVIVAIERPQLRVRRATKRAQAPSLLSLALVSALRKRHTTALDTTF